MSKSVTVTLAGTPFEVQKLNVGQLREVTKLFASASPAVQFDILALALKRAEPTIANLDALEPDFEEVATAVKAILENAGLKPAGAGPLADRPAA